MKKKQEGHVIASIEPGSIAEELELEPGDVVLAVNDNEIEDVFDYHYLINDEYLLMPVSYTHLVKDCLRMQQRRC